MSFYQYEIHGNKYDFQSKMFDAIDVVEEAAEDYFDNHDGWESKWPLEITLLNFKDKNLGTFKVEMEARPYFSAVKT